MYDFHILFFFLIFGLFVTSHLVLCSSFVTLICFINSRFRFGAPIYLGLFSLYTNWFSTSTSKSTSLHLFLITTINLSPGDYSCFPSRRFIIISLRMYSSIVYNIYLCLDEFSVEEAEMCRRLSGWNMCSVKCSMHDPLCPISIPLHTLWCLVKLFAPIPFSEIFTFFNFYIFPEQAGKWKDNISIGIYILGIYIIYI